MSSGPFLTGLGLCAGVELVVFVASWVAARLVGRWNVVDVTWGLSYVAVAAASFGWSVGTGGDPVRRGLVLALTATWGLRLAGYIAWRSRGHGEDPRYRAILDRAEGSEPAYALGIIFLPQALIAWFVSLPVQAAMYERHSPGAVTLVGGSLWAVGMFFETVGDAQMAAFRADPANRGQVMDRGLWRYTRHPNYFGDATVWAGLYLIAAQQWPGWLTFLSPLVMLYFLYFKSGKGLLEKGLTSTKPGYAEYVARTSGFFPRPPRRLEP